MTGAVEPSAIDAGPAPEGLVDEIEQVTIEPGPIGGAVRGETEDTGAAALDAGPPDTTLVDEIEAALLMVDEARDAVPPEAAAAGHVGGASDEVDAADAGAPPAELTTDVEALDDD